MSRLLAQAALGGKFLVRASTMTTKMLDTITLRRRHECHLQSELRERGFRRICGRGHDHADDVPARWVLSNLPAPADTLRLTWSKTVSGDWLSAECSLPHLIHGNNCQLPSSDDEVRYGLNRLSELVSTIAGVPFDAHAALVGRADFANDFSLGSEQEVLSYIGAVSSAGVVRMRRIAFADSTVTFDNKAKVIRLYAKRAEVEHRLRQKKATPDELQLAAGKLRLESSFRKSESVRRLSSRLGLCDRSAASLLTSEIARTILHEAMKVLGLNKMIQPADGHDTRLDTLRSVYGDTTKFRRLAGFLALLDHFGTGFHKQGIAGYSKSSYYRDAADLRRADVWLKLTSPSPKALPALWLSPTENVRAA